LLYLIILKYTYRLYKKKSSCNTYYVLLDETYNMILINYKKMYSIFYSISLMLLSII